MSLKNSNLIKKLSLLIFGIASIGIGVTFITLNIQNEISQNEIMTYDGNQRAVIIDQLYGEYPNEVFHKLATEYLEKGGYKVDIITTDDVTVDFFKKLPSMNYEYIIYRGHSLADGNVKKISSATLFTGEKHDYHKYIKEQFQGFVSTGVPYLFSDIEEMGGFENLQNQTYFVIGSKFVNEAMVGKFQDSTIILGGCNTVEKSHLAKSFLKRGASVVIGWDDLVDAGENDMVILQILNESLENDFQILQAVQSVKKQIEGKLMSPSTLVYQFRND